MGVMYKGMEGKCRVGDGELREDGHQHPESAGRKSIWGVRQSWSLQFQTNPRPSNGDGAVAGELLFARRMFCGLSGENCCPDAPKNESIASLKQSTFAT